MDFVKIGNALTMLRIQKGLTCEKVGEYTGIPFKSISHYENGRPVTLKNLNILAIYYQTTMDNIVSKDAVMIINFT